MCDPSHQFSLPCWKNHRRKYRDDEQDDVADVEQAYLVLNQTKMWGIFLGVDPPHLIENHSHTLMKYLKSQSKEIKNWSLLETTLKAEFDLKFLLKKL